MYKTLYGRKCRIPLYWSELSERKIADTDLITETEEKVKRKVLRFDKKGKLSPNFIGSYEVLERIRPITYHWLYR
ncbi:coilin-like [Gossypium australe]|uniref:Coilin-like n=1 Tax=Gossypium australe TaxID=47621 RepID=A0A5B6WT90_9ROSI|nr:coilin-like [Gossypium australe]